MTPTPSVSPTLQSSFLILDIGHKSDMEQIIKCMGKKNQNPQHQCPPAHSITGCHLLSCYIPSTWCLGFLLGHHTAVSMWLVLFTSKGKVFASLSKSNRSPDALRHLVVNCTKETAAHTTVRWLLAHRERQTHAPPASGHLNTCFAQPSTCLVHSDLGLYRGHTKKKKHSPFWLWWMYSLGGKWQEHKPVSGSFSAQSHTQKYMTSHLA